MEKTLRAALPLNQVSTDVPKRLAAANMRVLVWCTLKNKVMPMLRRVPIVLPRASV